MGGSAILGNNLIDGLVPMADSLRGSLNLAMGTRQFHVYTVRAVWSPSPALPTVVPHGTPGSTSYSYLGVANYPDGTQSAAGSVGVTTTGPATLSAINFNRTTWVFPTGATTIDVYRVVGGATQGKIGTLTAPTAVLDDTGLPGDGKTASTALPNRGEGVATRITTEILPAPKVDEAGDVLKHLFSAIGRLEVGDLALSEVSLTYVENELTGYPLLQNEEFYFKMMDQWGQGLRTRYFTHTGPPWADRQKSIGWIVSLKRCEMVEV